MSQLPSVTRMQAWAYGLFLAGGACALASPFRGDLVQALRADASPLLAAILYISAAVVSLFIHEMVHAAGFLLCGGVPFSRIEFGWRTVPAFQLYTCVRAPVTLWGFRFGMLFPSLLLGFMPVLVGIGFDSPVFVALGVSNLAGCGNDLGVVLASVGLRSGTRIEMNGVGFDVHAG